MARPDETSSISVHTLNFAGSGFSSPTPNFARSHAYTLPRTSGLRRPRAAPETGVKSAAVRRHAPVRSAPRFPARHTTGADGDAPPSSLPRSTIGPFRPAKTPSISTTTPPGAPAFFNARTASFAFAGVLNGRAADPSPASSPLSASTCRTAGAAPATATSTAQAASSIRLIALLLWPPAARRPRRRNRARRACAPPRRRSRGSSRGCPSSARRRPSHRWS